MVLVSDTEGNCPGSEAFHAGYAVDSDPAHAYAAPFGTIPKPACSDVPCPATSVRAAVTNGYENSRFAGAECETSSALECLARTGRPISEWAAIAISRIDDDLQSLSRTHFRVSATTLCRPVRDSFRVGPIS